jgi:hypothetical protein
MFFRLPSGERFAVVGGHALALVQLDVGGAWRPTQEIDELSHNPRWGYKPLAVFDLDGDGVPEIVVRIQMEEAWHDAVLKRDDHGFWHKVAVSIGGGTA